MFWKRLLKRVPQSSCQTVFVLMFKPEEFLNPAVIDLYVVLLYALDRPVQLCLLPRRVAVVLDTILPLRDNTTYS